ncbi:MAG: zinc metallopeptidase [Clostridia bacterium]|nr:zinc metallopeptidase [Clostridia bacterium]
MDNIIILIVGIISILLIYFALNINIKRIKQVKENERIKKFVDKFPEDEEICKSILQILKNEKVKIEINQNNKDCVYIAISDKIILGNIKDVYTRIQTIAHECIHSVQDRKLLLFNFFYTNIYNFYFIISVILTIFGIFKNTTLQIVILLFLGIIFYVVRSYLETDAMIRAEYLAEEYMIKYIEENKICTNDEVQQISNEYENINKIGIPTYNLLLVLKTSLRVVLYTFLVIVLGFII